MNVIRRWIRDLLGFSGREVNGFLILLPLMVLLVMVIPMYQWQVTNRTEDFSQEQKKLDSLVALWNVEKPQDDPQIQKPQARLFFTFNPNTANIAELRKLGFSEFLATRIVNYRLKGGQFRVKADLLKIYNMDSSLYHSLYTYIQLPEKGEVASRETVSTKTSLKKEVYFDLNNADTSEFKSVYGIGPVLAQRIVKFRDGLGGFIDKGQLKEVYGLDSTTVHELSNKTFISADFTPRKLDVNTADEKQLSSHPYIRKFLAKAIVAYRFQHGAFNNLDELSKISVLKPEEMKRIIPYLKVN